MAGEALRTWASATIVKNETLTTTGPYQLTRNPLYVGNFLVGFGVAVMGGSLWLLVVFAILFIAVYRRLALKEEKRLLNRYGAAFKDYCAGVPRFIPKWKNPRFDTETCDLRRMWIEHGEWKAWLGLYAVTLLLLLRAN